MRGTVVWTALLLALGAALLPGRGGAQQGAAPPGQGVPVRRSWTSDRHALKAGDIVTILVDEFILASANMDQMSSQEKGRDLGLTAAMPGSTMGGGLKTQNDVADRQQGESVRQQRFSGEITARVVEVSPTGMARVEGTKKLQIDEVEEEVTLRGWIRPQDISLQNTVESWRVSEAQILYASTGTLGKPQGFLTRLLNKIWP